jgi:fatty acid desaturase
LFIIGHDGMHRRLFDTTERNDLFCDALLLGPIGAITRVNNRNHLAHHQFLSTDDDPDRYKHACFNKSNPIELAGYLTGASIAKNVGNVFHVKASDATPSTTSTRPSYRPRDLAIMAAWQVLLLAGLTRAFGWWGYVLMWWVPVFVFMFLADNLRTFCEHSHTESDALADRHRLVTNKPRWLERQLLSPMNMNYHAAHHLWPSIPYYNLPQADAEMAQSPAASTITWRGSYLSYLRRYSRALPIEDCGTAPAGA